MQHRVTDLPRNAGAVHTYPARAQVMLDDSAAAAEARARARLKFYGKVKARALPWTRWGRRPQTPILFVPSRASARCVHGGVPRIASCGGGFCTAVIAVPMDVAARCGGTCALLVLACWSTPGFLVADDPCSMLVAELDADVGLGNYKIGVWGLRPQRGPRGRAPSLPLPSHSRPQATCRAPANGGGIGSS